MKYKSSEKLLSSLLTVISAYTFWHVLWLITHKQFVLFNAVNLIIQISNFYEYFGYFYFYQKINEAFNVKVQDDLAEKKSRI